MVFTTSVVHMCVGYRRCKGVLVTYAVAAHASYDKVAMRTARNGHRIGICDFMRARSIIQGTIAHVKRGVADYNRCGLRIMQIERE